MLVLVAPMRGIIFSDWKISLFNMEATSHNNRMNGQSRLCSLREIWLGDPEPDTGLSISDPKKCIF